MMFRTLCLLSSIWLICALVAARYVPILPASGLIKRTNLIDSDPIRPQDVLLQQYKNPAGTLAVLLLVGSDLIQKSIAQLVGQKGLTPVAFSFGWVSFAFVALNAAWGPGTLMPQPDFPCQVINLKSWNSRHNESWAVGRLLRDLEIKYDKAYKEKHGKQHAATLKARMRLPRITVLRTVKTKQQERAEEQASGSSNSQWVPKRDRIWFTALVAVPLQLLVAAAPIMRKRAPLPDKNWTILMLTMMGNLLATLTSSMAQWRDEKFDCRKDSKEGYVITRGNGHSHVFVILNGGMSGSKGISLNLEDLAVPTLLTSRATRWSTVVLASCWTFVLVTVAGLKRDAWYLLGVGIIGMIQNLLTATRRRDCAGNGVFLHEEVVFQSTVGKRAKVMDPLFEAEKKYAGLGFILLPIFYPGTIRGDEALAWLKLGEDLRQRQAELKMKLRAIAAGTFTKDATEDDTADVGAVLLKVHGLDPKEILVPTSSVVGKAANSLSVLAQTSSSTQTSHDNEMVQSQDVSLPAPNQTNTPPVIPSSSFSPPSQNPRQSTATRDYSPSGPTQNSTSSPPTRASSSAAEMGGPRLPPQPPNQSTGPQSTSSSSITLFHSGWDRAN